MRVGLWGSQTFSVSLILLRSSGEHRPFFRASLGTAGGIIPSPDSGPDGERPSPEALGGGSGEGPAQRVRGGGVRSEEGSGGAGFHLLW